MSWEVQDYESARELESKISSLTPAAVELEFPSFVRDERQPQAAVFAGDLEPERFSARDKKSRLQLRVASLRFRWQRNNDGS